MLEEVMRYVNNRFDRDRYGMEVGSLNGEFTIVDGTVFIPGLKNGQWFWVEGSDLNDGLHKYPATDMADETFEGRVVFLRVPQSLVSLADEIAAWNEANATTVNSPYSSESFGGYSYSKATGATSGNEMPAAAWQVQFGARLRPYRKLSRDWV